LTGAHLPFVIVPQQEQHLPELTLSDL
jgi:hypothetical protein